MTAHQNRGGRAGKPGSNPTPEQVKRARERAGLTQSQAAAVVYAAPRTWQQWEQEAGTPGANRMHPGLWELFRLKTADTLLELVTIGTDREK